MNAIGPSFNIPKTWKKNGKNGKNGKKESSSMSTEEYVPLSLYFFKLIAEEDRSKWMPVRNPPGGFPQGGPASARRAPG